MDDELRLGRVAGVTVHTSWSVLVIVGLLAWTLGAGVLREVAPATPVVGRWALAVITALAFIACLLAHELGHATVARAAGIEVDGITLWMFGGMSRLKGESPDPATEQRMALAGPVISLELGLALIGAGIVLEALGAPQATVAAATWLGLMNGVLAALNLLPAYPLDGGRVLRAIVGRRTGDLRRATAVATAVGRSAGYGLFALGVAAALVGAVGGGIWMALLGWLVLDAARTEHEGFELRHLLRGAGGGRHDAGPGDGPCRHHR